MAKFKFPIDQWQHVEDENDVPFDMQMWTDDVNGNKYVSFFPVKQTQELDEHGDNCFTTDTLSEDSITYLLTEGYVEPFS